MPRKIEPLWERVWAKVAIDPQTTFEECWPWGGAKSKKRRGQMRPVIKLGPPHHRSKVGLVTRIVCEWYHGPPPTPVHEAGHICPNGERDDCVNPRHLEWQTREENEQHKQASHARLRLARTQADQGRVQHEVGSAAPEPVERDPSDGRPERPAV